MSTTTAGAARRSRTTRPSLGWPALRLRRGRTSPRHRLGVRYSPEDGARPPAGSAAAPRRRSHSARPARGAGRGTPRPGGDRRPDTGRVLGTDRRPARGSSSLRAGPRMLGPSVAGRDRRPRKRASTTHPHHHARTVLGAREVIGNDHSLPPIERCRRVFEHRDRGFTGHPGRSGTALVAMICTRSSSAARAASPSRSTSQRITSPSSAARAKWAT